MQYIYYARKEENMDCYLQLTYQLCGVTVLQGLGTPVPHCVGKVQCDTRALLLRDGTCNQSAKLFFSKRFSTQL